MSYEASPEQIEEWKKKHGQIYMVKAGDKVCYLKKPTRQGMSYASSIARTNPMKSNEHLLNDCWLGGDPEIKTDDSLFMGVAAQLPELIDVQQTELVKL